jgi:lysozyme
MNMLVSPIGLAALKSREGVRLTAYKDSVGVWTIGYGSTKGVKPGDRITQAEADALLERDIDEHARPILDAVKVPLADHEADALVSIAFNIGVGGFKGSTFLKRLNEGNRASCAANIMLWKKPPEIISRRTAERDQFLTPYSVALPKARSTDARPVSVPVGVAKPDPNIVEPSETTVVAGSLIAGLVAKCAEIDSRLSTVAVAVKNVTDELNAIREAQAALQSDVNALG